MRRRCVTYLRNGYAISERRARKAMQMNRSSYRYAGRQDLVDAGYREVVRSSERNPYFGYRKIYDLMRGSWPISRERLRQNRRREGLQVVKKRRTKKCLGMTAQWIHRADYPNHVWSYELVFDQTVDGQKLKCLTVINEFTRQGLAIRVGQSPTAIDVTHILDALFRQNGRPVYIRSDNGPALVLQHVQNWLRTKHVDTHYIDPGSPWQNACNKCFNSIFRTTCVGRCLFGSITEARIIIIGGWLDECNTVRPHGSLGGMTPATFLQRWTQVNIDQQPKYLTG